MRSIVILFVICIGLVPCFAQEQAEPRTLLGGVQDVSLFISPALKGTQLNSQYGLMAGGSAGIMLDHVFYIGAAGYKLFTDVKASRTGADSTSIDMQYGGGILGYRLGAADLFHIGLQGVIGYGEVEYGHGGRGHHHDELFDDDNGAHGSSRFYVAEPSVTAELNLVSHVQLGVEAGYRFCMGVDSTMAGVTNRELSGPSAAATLRVVIF
jgi:hypothetical protein